MMIIWCYFLLAANVLWCYPQNDLNIPVEVEIGVNNKATTTQRTPALLDFNKTSDFSATTLEPADSLVCKCSFPQSRYCTRRGTCNAKNTGDKLSESLQLAKTLAATLEEHREDSNEKKLREQFCKILTAGENVTDWTLLEFDEWEPACVRIKNSAGEATFSCSMAPKDDELGRINKEKINEKISAYHAFLQCPKNQPPTLLKGDLEFCRDENNCNTLNRIYENPSDTPESGDGLTQKQGFVYIGIPVLCLLVLIILGAIVVYSVGKSTGWKYTWHVFKAGAAGSNGAKSDVPMVPTDQRNA